MQNQNFQSCIDACNDCADACDMCISACLKEDDVKMMARCIALDIDCAQLCRLLVPWHGAVRHRKRFAKHAPKFAACVLTNAASTRCSTARIVLLRAAVARTSAFKWEP